MKNLREAFNDTKEKLETLKENAQKQVEKQKLINEQLAASNAKWRALNNPQAIVTTKPCHLYIVKE